MTSRRPVPATALAAALALALTSAPAAAVQTVVCDQGPAFACGPVGATALPPVTRTLSGPSLPFNGSLFFDRYTGSQPLAAVVVDVQLSTQGSLAVTNNSGGTCPQVAWQSDTSLHLRSPSHPTLCPSTLPLQPVFTNSGTFADLPAGATMIAFYGPDGYCGTCPSNAPIQIGPLTDPSLLTSLSGPGKIEFALAAADVSGVAGCSPIDVVTTGEVELTVTVQYFVCATECYGGDLISCPTGPTTALPPQSDEVTLGSLPANATLLLDRYAGPQPLLGAELTLEVTTSGAVDVVNLDPVTCPSVQWQLDTLLDLSSPTHPGLCASALPLSWSHTRTGSATGIPAGGVASWSLDPDGLCAACPTGTPLRIGPLLDPAVLTALSGPGQVQLDLSANVLFTLFSGCALLTNDTSDVTVRATLTYVVCAGPGAPLCFGDGSGAPCGCGNTGAPGAGCANSAGSGAVLSGSGAASLGNDTLVLEANMTTNLPGLMFQGDALLPNPMTFGDGIRCCGQNVLRVMTIGAQGNCASTDQPSGCGVQLAGAGGPISQLPGNAGLQPGDTRCYQWWYRDTFPTNPCMQSLFNLSNAYEVTWTP